MRTVLRAKLLATAMALSTVSLFSIAPVNTAIADENISFDYFHNELANYGDWLYSDRWGEVWQPANVDPDWRPYTRGHWVDTEDYGWLWVSDEDFGDITSHYGRWVNDPDDGWLWIPGYVWSPAWVAWRSSGDYTGWMPMPPDDRFLAGGEFGGGGTSVGISIGGVSVSFNDWNDTNNNYGYSRWYGRDYSPDRFNAMWTFVPLRHFADRDYRRYEAPRGNVTNIIRTSTNITNYTVVNNYIVNRSVSVQAMQRAGAPPIRPIRAADVVKRPALIVPIDRGRQIQTQMRTEMPRGTGVANSAPKPTVMQVKSLSTRALPRRPGAGTAAPSSHLLSHDAAAMVARPNGSTPVPLTASETARAKAAVSKPGTPGAPLTPSAPTPAEIRAQQLRTHGATPGGAIPATPSAPTPAEIRAQQLRTHGATPGGAIPATPSAPTPAEIRAQQLRTHGATPGGATPATPSAPTPAEIRAQQLRTHGATPGGAIPATPSAPAPAEIRAQQLRTHGATPGGAIPATPSAPAPAEIHTQQLPSRGGQIPANAGANAAAHEHALQPRALPKQPVIVAPPAVKRPNQGKAPEGPPAGKVKKKLPAGEQPQ